MSAGASKRQERRLPGRGETRSKSGSALAKWLLVQPVMNIMLKGTARPQAPAAL